MRSAKKKQGKERAARELPLARLTVPRNHSCNGPPQYSATAFGETHDPYRVGGYELDRLADIGKSVSWLDVFL